MQLLSALIFISLFENFRTYNQIEIQKVVFLQEIKIFSVNL